MPFHLSTERFEENVNLSLHQQTCIWKMALDEDPPTWNHLKVGSKMTATSHLYQSQCQVSHLHLSQCKVVFNQHLQKVSK